MFNQQKFAVIGLGITGVSVVKYLKSLQLQIVSVCDTRDYVDNFSASILDDYTKIKFGIDLDDADEYLDDADVLVISPGVNTKHKSIQNFKSCGKAVIGDIELFAHYLKTIGSHVIGITGSNGKTTVTSLTYTILKDLGFNAIVAGNIGTPVLDECMRIQKTQDIPDVVVLELSSFQLDTTSTLHLNSAAVLNISADHLDRYDNLEAYSNSKAQIFNNCDHQVLNYSDYLARGMKKPHTDVTWFSGCIEDLNVSHNDSLMLIRDNWLVVNGIKYIACQDLGLIGAHNYCNVLASLALITGIVDIFLDKPRICNTLRNFTGLPHRMQKVLKHDGVTYIEDSKGTNVGAVIAGVSGLDGERNILLILGGDGKNQDFAPLKDLVQLRCKAVALIGMDKFKIHEVLKDLKDTTIIMCDTLPSAIESLRKLAICGDYVILSPACASWDMFKDYKHRAQVFTDYVIAING